MFDALVSQKLMLIEFMNKIHVHYLDLLEMITTAN